MAGASGIRWKRWWIALGALASVLLLVAFLLPYLLKRYIEEHSVEWIGRRVTIERIVLNPFTFRYAVQGVTCYEPGSEAVFVSWKRISVRSNLWAGFREDHWRFRDLRIEAPYFHIVQNGERFNFSDLLELGGADTAATDTASAAARFSMEDIELSDGRIEYASDVLASPVSILNLSASSNLISSDRARMEFGLGFEIGGGGRMDGGFMLDTDAERYAIDARLKDFALRQLLPYLQDFFACNDLDGALDVDLRLLDSYTDTTSLAISGGVDLKGVRLTDPDDAPLLSLRAAAARLDTLVAHDQRVEMGAVRLDGAALRFTLLADGTDNWTRLLKLDTTAVAGDSVTTALQVSESNVFVMLADYIRYLGEQVVASDYTAKRMELSDGSVHFEDHTPAQPFTYAITGISVLANSFTSDQEAGKVSAGATLQETGRLKADAVFDPKDLRRARVDLVVDALDLHALDAYGRWYAAHPFEDGQLRYETSTTVDSGRIDSRNHLRIDKLRFGKRVEEHDPEIYVLPLPLAAGLLKDVRGVVELDVPVQGDLKDPEFRPWPIVWQVLKNLVVKAATAPGRLLVRAVGGTDEDDLERVRFEPLQAGLNPAQARTLRQLAKVLAAKPELSVDLVSLVDSLTEAREAALFEVKRAYLLPDAATLSEQDSARIAGLSAKDSTFLSHVEALTPGLSGKPLRERCMTVLGAIEARRIQGELEYARRENLMQFLLAEGVPPERVRYREGTPEELAGKRGAPGYLFVYEAAD
ncbi:MAG: DUF748 domain-containing protein [Flavobacteriales bacterium]|nr:DUF748 domain-containing protein [Flavobacteriales bacterium]